MVEIEIGVLRGQCLDRRIGEREVLIAEIDAWQRRRNASGARIKWKFTTQKARNKLARPIPTPPKSYNHCAEVLVAPVIAYVPEGNTNPPTSHMRFPGTITVPTDVFEMTIESAAESFRVHGFTNIVLLGDHGGYQGSLKVVAERLNRKWASTHARVHYIPEYYKAVETTFVKELQVRGLGPDIGTHADLTDTSLMLAVDASMVRLKQLQSAPKPDASTGVYGGDPRKSSAELGRLGIDAQMSETVQAIRRAVAQR